MSRDIVLTGPPAKSDRKFKGLGHYISNCLKKRDGALSLQIDAVTRKVQTRGTILMHSACVAEHMAVMDIGEDDVVMICSLPNINCTLPLLASFYLGCIVTALNPLLHPDVMEYLLKEIHPSAIFCDEDSHDKLKACLVKAKLNPKIIAFGDIDNTYAFDKFLDRRGVGKFRVARTPDPMTQTAVIAYSAGNSNENQRPNIVELTHYSVYTQIKNINNLIKNADINLVYSPLSFLNTLIFTLAIVCADVKTDKHTIVMCPWYLERVFLDYIAEFSINAICLERNQLTEIVNFALDECNNWEPSKSPVRTIFVTGASPSCEEFERYKLCFPGAFITSTYYLVEAGGFVSAFNSCTDDLLSRSRPRACGKVLDGFKVKIKAPQNSDPIGPKNLGMIYVNGEAMLKKFKNNEGLLDERIDEEGFYNTGDLGYADIVYECLYVIGREEEIIKTCKRPVLPDEVVNAFLKHPAVADCVALGIPKNASEDWLLAFIVPKDGSFVKIMDLEKFISGDNEADNICDLISLVDFIPKTRYKTVHYNSLKDLFLEGAWPPLNTKSNSPYRYYM